MITPREALAQAKHIAGLAKIGALSYSEAKKKCLPLLSIINEKGSEIAKKYNRRYAPITFTGLAR